MHYSADEGGDLNVQSYYEGWTPLILAVLQGNTEITELLLRRGADVTPRDNQGKTAYDWALDRPAFAERKDLLEMLGP